MHTTPLASLICTHHTLAALEKYTHTSKKQYPHPPPCTQIPKHNTHFLTSLSPTPIHPTMTSHIDTTMKAAVVDSRTRSKKTRSIGGADRSLAIRSEEPTTALRPHQEGALTGAHNHSSPGSHDVRLASNPQPHSALQAPNNAPQQLTPEDDRRGGPDSGTGGAINHRGAGTRATSGAQRSGGSETRTRPKRQSDTNPPTGPENHTRHSYHPKTRSKRVLLGDYNEEDEEAGPEEHVDIHELPPPPHDCDIDMQLADVSPEHGGSSLRLSMTNEEFTAAPNQAAIYRLDTSNLAATTPTSTAHKSPRKVTTIDNHSAKRRRSEEGKHTTHSDSNKSHNMRSKEAIPSIEMMSQMWLGFPIHEAIATHKGQEVLREHRTNEDFAKLGTPPREVIDFMTLRRAYPQVPQALYPHERPDAVPGNHLHFTQPGFGSFLSSTS